MAKRGWSAVVIVLVGGGACVAALASERSQDCGTDLATTMWLLSVATIAVAVLAIWRANHGLARTVGGRPTEHRATVCAPFAVTALQWIRYPDDDLATYAKSSATDESELRLDARAWFEEFCRSQLPDARATDELQGLMFRSDAVNGVIKVCATGAEHRPVSRYFFTLAAQRISYDKASEFDALAGRIAVDFIAGMSDDASRNLTFHFADDLGNVNPIEL